MFNLQNIISMKKIFYFNLGIILMCIVYVSCSNHQEANLNIRPRLLGDNVNPYESLNVSDYVSSHSSVFGSNVLIFDSVAQADSVLYSWQNSDYTELRTQCNLLNHYNANIENIISIDSIHKDILQGWGYSSEDELEDTYMLDSLTYLEVMQLNPNLLYSYNMVDNNPESEHYGETYSIIEPSGQLDFNALLNSNRLCVIENNVVKRLLDGNLISSPLLNYQLISGYESIAALEVLNANAGPTNFNLMDTTAIIWQPLYDSNSQRFSNMLIGEDENKINNKSYRMTLRYKVARLYNLIYQLGGDHILSAHLTIKNYKKGCLNKYWLSRQYTQGVIKTKTNIEVNHFNNPFVLSEDVPHRFDFSNTFATYIRYQSKYVDSRILRPDYYIFDYDIFVETDKNVIDNDDIRYGNE